MRVALLALFAALLCPALVAARSAKRLSDVRAFPEGNYVAVRWSPVTQKDVRYTVWRDEEMIGVTDYAAFIDLRAKPGQRATYRVLASWRSGRGKAEGTATLEDSSAVPAALASFVPPSAQPSEEEPISPATSALVPLVRLDSPMALEDKLNRAIAAFEGGAPVEVLQSAVVDALQTETPLLAGRIVTIGRHQFLLNQKALAIGWRLDPRGVRRIEADAFAGDPGFVAFASAVKLPSMKVEIRRATPHPTPWATTEPPDTQTLLAGL